MNYATGCAFNLDEMFINFPYDKLLLTCELAKKINNDPHRDKLVKKIFRKCVQKVLEDVIQNNTTFNLPTLSTDCNIHMKRISKDDFTKARLNGKFLEIDFLESLFSGYELKLEINRKNKVSISKNIYVDTNLKNLIIKNTNKGMQYC